MRMVSSVHSLNYRPQSCSIAGCAWPCCRVEDQVPAAWSMQVNTLFCRPAFMVLLIWAIFKLAMKAPFMLQSSVYFVSGAITLSLWCVANHLIWLNIRPDKLQQCLILITLLLNTSASYHDALNLDSFVDRTRSLFFHHIGWKLCPLLILCSNLQVFILVGWSLVTDFGAYWLANAIYGDAFPAMLAALLVFNSGGFLLCGLVSQARLKALYHAQELSKSKSVAFETMLSMLCDGFLWVAEDGETVIKNDGRCELLTNIGAAGHEKLSDMMKHDTDEGQRLSNAFQRSRTSPVLFHSICSAPAWEFYTVDLFIVNQAHIYNAKDVHNAECSQGFLVGVCQRSQLICHPIQCPLDTVEDLAETEQESEANPPESEAPEAASHPDEEGSGSETPTTTTTGKIFECSEDIKDMCDSMAEIVRPGRKEHWLVEAHQLHVVPSCVLGEGSFTMVVEGYFHGQTVAVKMPSAHQTSRSIRSLIHEVRMLRRLRHPGIVLFHGVCIADRQRRIGLIFERVQGTSLRSFIKCQSPCPDMDDQYQLAVDVCEALRYLHGHQ